VTNFLSIGQGGSILQGVEFWYSPLTKAVAVNTVLRYRTPVIKIIDHDQKFAYVQSFTYLLLAVLNSVHTESDEHD